MKFHGAAELKDMEGNTFREPVKGSDGNLVDVKLAPDGVSVVSCKMRPQTHGLIAARALTHKFEGDKDLNSEELPVRYVLGARLIAADECELTIDEAKLIKERVAKFGMMAAPIIMALDEAAKSPKLVASAA